MVKLKINNIETEFPEGTTILDAAEKAGIIIPTLCFKKGLPHYSSCMVCMVKDKRTNGFIPSCSASVQEGMDIDASSDDVIQLRKKSVELLLSEHRAECEAPCRIVCPAGYNIPKINRLLASKDYNRVIELLNTYVTTAEVICADCAGYCENACRRKKVDKQVSIRNIILFLSKYLNPQRNITDTKESAVKRIKDNRPFSSRTGVLSEAEFREWPRECKDDLVRFTEIINNESASSEAESCMHCDCRASEDCRLRDLAQEFSLKDPKGKLINSPIVKKINRRTGLIFENAKCIKCGLCVRLCEDLKEEPALCFINRGFVTIISEPLTEEFDNILSTRSNEVIEICPTGALSKLK